MAQQPGNEAVGHLRQSTGSVDVDKGIGVALEQRQVAVHPRTLYAGQWFGHEAGEDALLTGHLFDHQAHGHDGVGHGEGVGVAQVDLVLAGGVLVLGVFNRDAHLLEGEHRALADVAGPVGHRELEVRAGIEGGGSMGGVGVSEIEVFDLGSGEESEAAVVGPVEGAAQDVAGASLEGRSVQVDDVTEDSGHLGIGALLLKPACPWPCQGRSWKVLASGRARTSLSWTRLNPSMADPSNVMPSTRAFSNSAGVMENVLGVPSTSVNHSWTKRTPRSSTVRRTYSS